MSNSKRMCSLSRNDMKSLRDEVNSRGIQKEQIVTIYRELDGTCTVVYYEED